MPAVTATDFAKGFGRYKEEAQREPIAITSHGRISGYFISAHAFDELQRLRALERRVYGVGEVPREVAEAIEKSRMDPSHNHLDALLDEKDEK